MTEQQIIIGLKKGDAQVFAWLRKRYGGRVVGYVIKNKGTQDRGEQLLHDTIVKVWQNVVANKYKANGKFNSYFITIAANTWRDELRRQKRKPTTPLSEEVYHLEDTGAADLNVKLAKEKHIQLLYQAIQELEDLCRDLIIKFHLKGISLRDLAAEQGTKYASMPKKVYDCRRHLKRKLEEMERLL